MTSNRHQDSVTDREGDALPGAEFNLYVLDSPSTPVAMYKDAGLTMPYGAGENVTDANGFFYLYAAAGRYDLEVTFQGSQITREDVLFFDVDVVIPGVKSVNGDTGVVVLTASDVGADASGSASAAQAAAEATAAGYASAAQAAAEVTAAGYASAAQAAAISTAATYTDTKIGGSAGAIDNRLLRADGTGTKTLQASGITVSDADELSGHGSKINDYSDSGTLALADAGCVVRATKATAMTLTVPPQSSVAWNAGAQIGPVQYGAGQLTIAAGSGVTIRSAGGKLKLTAQYSGATLLRVASDEWMLIGDITT